VPMTGLDARGNPLYDLTKMQTIVPRDPSENPIFVLPAMAVRSEDGSIYVNCRSKFYPKPREADFGWMAGWVLIRYGKMLWHRRVPEASPGMDVIPGGSGVMLVSIKWAEQGCEIYHYNQDGSLIGIARPSKAFLGHGGIPDNTASLGMSRDPRDGILDVFVEDCVGNRYYWLRVDDRKKPKVHNVRLRLLDQDPTLSRRQ
jgi:hypothetical protein